MSIRRKGRYRIKSNIPLPGHLDGLLLASMGVFMQCLDHCLSKSWRQKEDSRNDNFWRVSSTQQTSSASSSFAGGWERASAAALSGSAMYPKLSVILAR